MRTWSMVFSLLFMMTFGFASASITDAFEGGQTITLKAKTPKGVPLHPEAESSYWKHVPYEVQGTIHQVAQTGWLYISLETGEKSWVSPKYVEEPSPSPASTEITMEKSDPSPELHRPAMHTSSAQEEALVWKSPEHCREVVKDGGRMAVYSSKKLRIGTWNIRWFPSGQPPNRSGKNDETHVPWLICTMVWMNLDVLAVEESLSTPKAKQAWKIVLESLEHTTGDSWQWTPQRCGKADSHKIGFVWNARHVELTQVQSLWPFNVKAQSKRNPCKGGLRPGHYAYVQSRQQPGADFHLIALHLKSGPTVFALENRHRALNHIDQTISQFLSKDQDTIILGDFNTMGAGDNASKKSEVKHVRRMVAKEMPGFRDLSLAPPCSHYFRGRGGWLDHVLVNTGMEEVRARAARVTGYCAVAECRRIKGDYPLAYQRLSDHCPVVIEIDNQDKD